MKKLNQSLLALGLTLLSSASLLAATSTWDGDTDTLFSTALNWDAAPGTGAALVFPSAASYTVDFTGVNPNNGPITFNASSDYLLTPAGQTLTLRGGITQSGSGAVTSDINLDLGGATRNFGGAGTGLARFNGVISGAAGNAINITGGSYALAAVNTFDGGLAAVGGTVKLIQVGFGDLYYEAGSDPAGLGDVTLNGGRIELFSEDPLGTIQNHRTTTFGASGGTLVYSNYNKLLVSNLLNQNVINGPARIEAYPARLPSIDPVSGDDGSAGPMQFQYPQGTGVCTLVLRNGASARFQQWSTTPFGGTIIVDGQPGGDMLADQQDTAPNQGTNIVYLCINNPNVNPTLWFPNVAGGIFLKNAMQIFETHSGNRPLDSDVTVTTGARVACMGRPITGKPTRLDFGKDPGVRTFTVEDDGVAQLDLQLSMWPDSDPGDSVGMQSSVLLKAGGTMRVARTTGTAEVKNIQFFGLITGQGTAAKEALLDLQLDNGSGGNNGVTFNSGVSLVVNGTGTGGLRVQATNAAAMANLLTGTRYTGITGSGGVLTLALTNNDTLTGIRGPSGPSAVALGLDKQGGNSPAYVFADSASSLANYAGLVLKGGTAVVNDSSTISMQAMTLANSATIQMGTGGGSGAMLNFADSSAKTWSGTLTIANWNGAVYGGGADQIKFGATVGGLTAAQLAQIKWINPFGSGDVTGAYQLSTGEIVPAVGQSQFVAGSIVPPHGATPFSATVNGVAGKNYRVLGTYILSPPTWVPVATGTGSFSFSDPNSLTHPARFYKVVTP